MPGADFPSFLIDFQRARPWLPRPLARHYARLYGTRAERLLEGARSPADFGRHFGGTLYEREVAYLRSVEWARSAEDILERRTKHGLHLGPSAADALAEWLAAEALAEGGA